MQCHLDTRTVELSQQTCKTFNGCGNPVIECPFDANLGHMLPPNWPADTWSFFASFK